MELSEEQMEAIRLKAEEGDRDAQYELGWRHAIGMGFDMDDEVALDWLSKAAEQGHPLAQKSLGQDVPLQANTPGNSSVLSANFSTGVPNAFNMQQ